MSRLSAAAALLSLAALVAATIRPPARDGVQLCQRMPEHVVEKMRQECELSGSDWENSDARFTRGKFAQWDQFPLQYVWLWELQAPQIERAPDDWSVNQGPYCHCEGDSFCAWPGTGIAWHVLHLEHLVVLLLGGGLLTFIVRRERRRNAAA